MLFRNNIPVHENLQNFQQKLEKLHYFFKSSDTNVSITTGVILKLMYFDSPYMIQIMIGVNLTKVRPLFTLSHRGSDNSRLLIVFSANDIDQYISYFYATESRLNDFVIFKNNALRLKYAI